MRRAIENARIQVKLLITPALATLALALLCADALRGYTTEKAVRLQITATQAQMEQASDAKTLATGLQAMMFRFTTLGLMGSSRDTLQQLGQEIARREAALDGLMARAVNAATVPDDKARLLASWQNYQRQSSRAVPNLLNNLGWGATTARNAGLALDAVVAEADLQRRAANASLTREAAADAAIQETQKTHVLLALVLGSPLLIALNVFIARCIAEPIRRLTAAMTRLAERHYDVDVPATLQRDEVGSMARAVQVFKVGMMRADVLAGQQQATQAFLDTVLENVPASIVVMDARDSRCLHVNRAGEVFLGVPRNSLLGKDGRDVLPQQGAFVPHTVVADPQSAGTPARTTQAVVEEGVLFETVSNGQRLATVTRLAIAGVDGRPQYLLTMMEDVTERRRAEERIAYMAHYDALTDLPNRTLFAERLQEAVVAGRADGLPLAVLGLDLDRFKEVNDTLGHPAGDELLRAVAARLADCLRAGDTFARLGGDEFAVIQRSVRKPGDAEALAGRLIERAREPFRIDGQLVFVGLSVGIAFASPDAEPSEMIKQADMALYEAKESGRGCFRCFAHDMDARLQQRRQLEVDLRAAVGTDQLFLHYQPQVELGSFAIVGAEALMRWNRPGHGAVPPSTFIPLAEDTGLMGELGPWLLHVACREAASWPGHLHVAVNVSPLQLRMAGFLDTVRDALEASGLAPHRLELEVTEGILLHDTEETLGIFNTLHALGVRLAMDDFGTGYASLAYLQKFRFDKIKIDRSFVKGLNTDPNASAIVRAVVGLSDLLGIATNAEGVETDEEIKVLRAHGCQEAQGFRFWRPMEAAAMRALAVGAEPNVLEPVAG